MKSNATSTNDNRWIYNALRLKIIGCCLVKGIKIKVGNQRPYVVSGNPDKIPILIREKLPKPSAYMARSLK